MGRKVYLIVEVNADYGKRNYEAWLSKDGAKRRVDELNRLASKGVEEPDYTYEIESLDICEDLLRDDGDDLK